MSRALEDVVLLDFTTEFWASLAAALLGDFGARVIRVENLPEARAPRARRDGQHPPSAWDYRAELVQRNKRSLGVDLEQDAGGEILAELVRTADVFLTDRPFSVLEARGWDYASLAKLRPDLIYARGSGFGPQGPDRDLPALDELAAARTGMMPILPQPGEPPVYAGAGQMYTSVMLAFGIVTALHHRQETGEGQEVDASLFAGNLYGASLDLQAFLAMGGERFLHPVSRLDAGNPMSGTLYPSEDGRWVTLTMPDTDRWWPVFSRLVGVDADDPRFDTHEKRCGENRLELLQVLEAAFQKQPGSHWRDAFNEHQLSADVIEDYAYPAGDAQAYRNRYILKLQHPSLGEQKTLGFPIFMSDSPARLSRSAPCLGQHSAEILHEMLGYSEERIGDLEDRGVIA
ncbi:MAG: CoA transferase [Deltaproteobacteria bacterium]|nr:MAG: CoA transferase [Deltaproteobacteria bacterium]